MPPTTRMLGLEIYMAGCAANGSYEPIPVDAANWRASLFRTLCFDGAQRPALSRALDAMVDNGLLLARDGRIHIAFKPEDPLFEVCSGSAQGLPGVCDAQVIETPQVTKTEEKRREESESAREADALLPWVRLGAHYRALYDAEQAGARNPRLYDTQRITSKDSKQFRELLELVNAEATRSGASPPMVFEAAAKAFLRDEKQQKKGLVLAYFVSDFTRYVDRSDLEAAS